MTNDQKLLLLINKTDELLKALDDQDTSNNASIYKAKAKKLRLELKIWLGMNKLVVTEQTPKFRKKVNPMKHSSKQNWLGQ